MAEPESVKDSSQELPAPLPNDTPSHFDDLIAADTATEAAVQSGASHAPVLNAEDFHKVFCTAFNVGSAVTGLKSLEVAENDDKARACSLAVFETCQDIPALNFLLQPGGKWGVRIMAIAAFTLPMARGVSQELQARQSGGESVAAGPKGNPADMLKVFNKA